MAVVVVEKLAPGDYVPDCAALPRDYGTAAWEARPEVAEIRRAVFAALDRLEAEGEIASRLAGKRVLVKPNLVTVYHRMGLERRTYPESTDPRVLDAAVEWISRRAASIAIVESSGRGAPTRGSFKVAGVDRLARRRGCELLALEEGPVDRYFLPEARVQREILVPRAFSAVVRGEAAYVSVPKLKTNLYTGVTLGFKNAMGVIPYNLRQRNHHYAIDRKLVEMLYLFRPDLVLIDGVVGGEGECPAPVDPVDSRFVIAGDHPVETDRAATRLMGFDPAGIELMRVADELGFASAEPARVLARGFGPGGDPSLGGALPVAFRPADWSLLSDRVRRRFPAATVLVGMEPRAKGPSHGAAPATAAGAAGAAGGSDFAQRVEASCRGGCVATTRFAFSMFEAEGLSIDRPLVIVLGGGVVADGGRRWYDAEGRSYDEAAIRALPGRKAAIGACARRLAPGMDRFVDGCMPLPNAPHMVLHALAKKPCRVMSLRNPNLIPLLAATLGQRNARRRLLEEGLRLDVPLGLDDAARMPEAAPPPAREAAEGGPAVRRWTEWPLPPLGPEEARRLMAAEDDAAIAAFRGVLVFRFKEKLLWRLVGAATGIATAAPLVLGLAALAAAGGAPPPPATLGLGPFAWFAIFGLVEALHLAELGTALRARELHAKRRGGEWSAGAKRLAIAATLLIGFPAWLPHRRGVFD
ncbi:MAG: DUF362 domain-containing protein [Spirochaetaceae bacterium]|nr:DUF362 domain-containing protein [Spirochaetaceae bacterium]